MYDQMTMFDMPGEPYASRKGSNNPFFAAATRAAKALGYRRIFTYTRKSEPGTSLKASNWTCDGEAGGTHWTGQRYEQIEMALDEMKVRWHKDLQ